MYTFDALKEKDRIIQWIRDFFEPFGPVYKAIIGISGGKDSTVAAALCKEALESKRVIGVMMPNKIQSDIYDSRQVINALNILSCTVNIGNTYDVLLNEISYAYTDIANQLNYTVPLITKDYDPKQMLHQQTITNLAPRLRMSTLYAIAQSFDGFVINTCNLSEDYIGWSTKFGDAAGDLAVLAHLTKTEVVKIGEALNLPDHLLYKDPADGLTGNSDEDNFGFTYEVLDSYIRTGECKDIKIKDTIDKMHKRNLHKLRPIPTIDS